MINTFFVFHYLLCIAGSIFLLSKISIVRAHLYLNKKKDNRINCDIQKKKCRLEIQNKHLFNQKTRFKGEKKTLSLICVLNVYIYKKKEKTTY
jgi:hypothetical protein